MGKDVVDIVFEATGHHSAYQTAVECCTVRGHLSFVGIPKTVPSIDVQGMLYKELHTSSARVYRRRDYASAIALLSRGAIDTGSLITDRVPLGQISEAYQLMQSATASGKIVITPGP